jgi:Family of unknown function (DUF6412)
MVRRFTVEVAVAAATRWGVLAVLACLWQVAGHLLVAPTGAAALAATMLAATVLASALVMALVASGLLARGAGPAPLTGQAAALRKKSWSAAFIRLRDPDAAGRSRPRAPSAGPAAA